MCFHRKASSHQNNIHAPISEMFPAYRECQYASTSNAPVLQYNGAVIGIRRRVGESWRGKESEWERSKGKSLGEESSGEVGEE